MSFRSMIEKICRNKRTIDLKERSGPMFYIGQPITKANPIVYTKQLVCFMDVMNYESSIVAGDSAFGNTEKLLAEISTLLNNLVIHGRKIDVADKNEKTIQMQIRAKFCVSLLFNCLVISYDLSEQREDLIDIYFALREISIVAVELARNGYFIKGGLAFGSLYHDKLKCIGPAIEKAILCYRKAIYPRIVIDNNFFIVGAEGAILSNTVAICNNYRQIKDKFHCVDVSNISNEGQQDIYQRDPKLVHFLDYLEITLSARPEIISEVKKNIEIGLSKATGADKEKFFWYAKYFNSIVYNRLCYEKDKCINIEK